MKLEDMALSMYLDEHCRVCGREYKTLNDLRDADVVFIGYAEPDDGTRTACRACYKRPLHFSDLKQFARSAAHYKYRVEHPIVMSREMRIGFIVDRLLTGGVVPPAYAGDRRGNDWKNWRALHRRSWRDDELATDVEMMEAVAIAGVVRTNDLATHYLTGRPQVPLKWETQGVPRETRGIDVVGPGWITDLKTTHCAEPEKLKRHARGMLWHAQLADYREACRQNGISTEDGVYLVCIESKPPYPATVLRLTEEALADGERCISQWIEQYKACEAAQCWPGYVQSVIPLEGWGEDVELTGFSEEEDDD